jgi:putative methyltransferase (TIGR04325 family)
VRGFRSDWIGSFFGVYDSFYEAAQAAPAKKAIGYDHEAPADMYKERLDSIVASDYPVMFWLRELVDRGARSLFDFGGHVGLAYHAYGKYFPFPEGFTWTVYDVPAVVATGQKIAEQRNKDAQLKFTNDTQTAAGCEILLAAGSLQYVESPSFDTYLKSLEQLPQHILLSKLPLGPKDTITLQNIGTAYCPYRVFADRRFVESLEDLGYEVVDRWKNAENCQILLRPERSVEHYSGMYLTLSPRG